MRLTVSNSSDLVARRIDDDVEGVLEKRDHLEDAEGIDDAAGDQRIVDAELAAADGGAKPAHEEAGDRLLRRHGRKSSGSSC